MYAFMQDVPGNEHILGQVKSRLGPEAPKGLIAHVVVKHDRGLRHLAVWETEADWERFRDEKVTPAVEEVLASMGIPIDQSQIRFRELEVIDTWLGDGN